MIVVFDLKLKGLTEEQGKVSETYCATCKCKHYSLALSKETRRHGLCSMFQ